MTQKIKLTLAKSNPEREARLEEAKNGMVALMQPWVTKFDLTADEALCLLSYMTGSALACQDQRRFTSAQAMELVAANIEAGNMAAIGNFLAAKGGRA